MRVCLAFTLLAWASIAAAQSEAEQTDVISTAVVPVAGTVTGANNVHWRTDLELHNDQKGEVTVVVTMPTAADANLLMLPIAPGGTLYFDDVSAALGVEGGLSPIVVQTNAKRSVGVRATVWGTRESQAIAPQPIAISYGSSYFPARVLRELSFSDQYRTNIGLVNLATTSADFTLALQRVAGRNIAVTHITIPPNALWHMSIQSAFPLITNGDHFEVVAETSVPDTYVYASVIDNVTNTARFVQPAAGISPPGSR